jgi:hypothetical protein
MPFLPFLKLFALLLYFFRRFCLNNALRAARRGLLLVCFFIPLAILTPQNTLFPTKMPFLS